MRCRRLGLAAMAALLLSGCGLARQKAAGYYLSKARRTAEARDPAPQELQAAFAYLDKALAYAPGSEAAVEVLGRLAEVSANTGFQGAQELQSAALRKALAGAPLNWAAREALTDFYGARGDTGGLEAMAAQARELYGSQDPATRYCALLAELEATASALPWIESEAYLSLNKSPETLFEKAASYTGVAAKVAGLKAELDRLNASDPSLKKRAPRELASAAEVAAADALKDPQGRAAIAAFSARTASDEAFRKAVEMTVRGNASLVKKDYPQARAFYRGALAQFPGLIDARRQLAETDFQEGASLAAAGEGGKEASRLLYKAYADSAAVIAEAGRTGNLIPFVGTARFLGEAYALKDASLAALSAVEGRRLRGRARLEADFKASLDEALKLSPEGGLARELLERYSKDGF